MNHNVEIQFTWFCQKTNRKVTEMQNMKLSENFIFLLICAHFFAKPLFLLKLNWCIEELSKNVQFVIFIFKTTSYPGFQVGGSGLKVLIFLIL